MVAVNLVFFVISVVCHIVLCYGHCSLCCQFSVIIFSQGFIAFLLLQCFIDAFFFVCVVDLKAGTDIADFLRRNL